MPLSQASRIAFSKKIVVSASRVASVESIKVQLQAEIAKSQLLEDGNFSIWNTQNNLVNLYQTERQYLSQLSYTTYTDADVVAASNLTSGNIFYPSTWLVQLPYQLARGLGLSTSPFVGEPTRITTFNASLAALLAISPSNQSNRITGQTCPAGGSGVNGVSLTATTGFSAAMSAAISDIGSLRSALSAEKTALDAIIAAETNSARQAQNTTERTSVLAAISAIDVWVGLTSTITYTQASNLTQVQFNAATASSAAPAPIGLDPTNVTKLNPINLTAIQAAITTRSAALATRTTQLTNYMGGLTQSLTTGVITATGGPVTSTSPNFYFSRAQALQLRIGLATGSLVSVNNMTRGKDSQDSQIASIKNEAAVYSTLLACSSFAADATNTYQVSVKDSSLFSDGDSIYLVSDNCDEIRATIQDIQGQRLVLTIKIPSRYLISEYSRLYKEL